VAPLVSIDRLVAPQRAPTAFVTGSAPLTRAYVIVGPLFEETIVRAALTPPAAGARWYRETCPALRAISPRHARDASPVAVMGVIM